ncbi:MAG: hypothetical protein IK127_07720 [Clostridia bacterium]|nr:hypothetical protein [Clostridia bacterium]
MKRRRIYCILIISGLLFSACAALAKPIPAGFVSKEEHFDPHGFQDYTDYCKYQYTSTEPFRKDTRYHFITDDEIENVSGYFEDFYRWMKTENRLDEYDFNQTCISAGDYVLIKTKEGEPIGDSYYEKYDNYTLYFFDTESLTLFYIHNNT